MGGKGSGRKNTGVVDLMRARIKDEFKLKRDKLTEEEVDKIKELRAQGLTQTAIARRLDVSQCTVCVYLMSPEDRKAYMANRTYAHKLWSKQHNNREEYQKVLKRKKHLKSVDGLIQKVLKRKKHLKSVDGLIQKDDWRGGVKVYEKQS